MDSRVKSRKKIIHSEGGKMGYLHFEETRSADGHSIIRIPIYNLHSGKASPQRYCDLIIDGENIQIEKKQSKEKYDTIPWEDLWYQVNAALQQLKSA